MNKTAEVWKYDIDKAKELVWKWAQRLDEDGNKHWPDEEKEGYFEFEDVQEMVNDIAQELAKTRDMFRQR